MLLLLAINHLQSGPLRARNRQHGLLLARHRHHDVVHEQRAPLPPQRWVDLRAVRELSLLDAGEGGAHDEVQDALAVFRQRRPARLEALLDDVSVSLAFPLLDWPQRLAHLGAHVLVPHQGVLIVLLAALLVLTLAELPVLVDDVLIAVGLPHSVADRPLLLGLPGELLEQDLLQLALLGQVLLALLLNQHSPTPALALLPCDAARALGLLDGLQEKPRLLLQLLGVGHPRLQGAHKVLGGRGLRRGGEQPVGLKVGAVRGLALVVRRDLPLGALGSVGHLRPPEAEVRHALLEGAVAAEHLPGGCGPRLVQPVLVLLLHAPRELHVETLAGRLLLQVLLPQSLAVLRPLVLGSAILPHALPEAEPVDLALLRDVRLLQRVHVEGDGLLLVALLLELACDLCQAVLLRVRASRAKPVLKEPLIMRVVLLPRHAQALRHAAA
mmetsp:Transcript_20040/g.58192  ORF Transcript_20040/g.58192 Transcript_20040/m.58192 type:complete len:441 (-) Transcript_20040:44-1366(-)